MLNSLQLTVAWRLLYFNIHSPSCYLLPVLNCEMSDWLISFQITTKPQIPLWLAAKCKWAESYLWSECRTRRWRPESGVQISPWWCEIMRDVHTEECAPRPPLLDRALSLAVKLHCTWMRRVCVCVVGGVKELLGSFTEKRGEPLIIMLFYSHSYLQLISSSG